MQRYKMRCIIYCYPPSIPSMVTHGKAKPKQYFSSVESFRPSKRISKASWILQWQNPRYYYGPFTTRATTLFLAATSPPNSGDFSVLFQTSAVMLLMYLIANFVVPDFLIKELQSEEANKDSKEEDQQNELGTTRRTRRTAGSGKRKKDFGRRRE